MTLATKARLRHPEPMAKCTAPDCDREAQPGRGGNTKLCSTHYGRARRFREANGREPTLDDLAAPLERRGLVALPMTLRVAPECAQAIHDEATERGEADYRIAVEWLEEIAAKKVKAKAKKG